MTTFVRGAAVALGVLALGAAAGAQESPANPYAQTEPVLTASLGTGDSGQFTAVVDQSKNQLCYMLNAPGQPDAVAAHIHKGAMGQNGPPVVPLAAPAGGASGGCVTVAPDVLQAMLSNAGGYYVNVHTPAYPAGAVRGQLVAHTPASQPTAG